MSDSEVTVGAILRWARTRRGVSARSLSIHAGLSDSVTGKVETELVDPSLTTFARIVCQLNLSDHEIAFLVHLAAHRNLNEHQDPAVRQVAL